MTSERSGEARVRHGYGGRVAPPSQPTFERSDALAGPLRVVLASAGAAPWIVPLARAWIPLGRLGSLLDAAFVLLCHRIPERTLVLAGVPMPVCSRCAGIFAGVLLGALVARPHFSLGWWRMLLAMASASMLADVVLQDTGVHPVWHPMRLATGLAFGYAAALTMLAALESAPAPSRRPRSERA